MGLGFVLLVWVILFGCVGLPVAGGLSFWSWRNERRSGVPSKARAAAAALLPFVLIAAGLYWFFAYAVHARTMRRADPSLGDGWSAPLPHDYFFCMIDVTDHGDIMKNGCTGVPRVGGVRELAQVGDIVVGSSDQKGAFVFNTATDALKQYPDRSTALASFSPKPSLSPTGEFYRSRRYGWQDAAWILLLFVITGSITWIWFRCFIKARDPARTTT